MLLCWVGAELREEGPRTSPAQLSCGLSDQPNARATHWSPAHSRGQSPHSFLPGDGGGARPPAFCVRSESHGQPENHQLASLLGGCRAGAWEALACHLLASPMGPRTARWCLVPAPPAPQARLAAPSSEQLLSSHVPQTMPSRIRASTPLWVLPVQWRWGARAGQAAELSVFD